MPKNIIVKMFKFAYTENIIQDTELFGRLELKTYKKKASIKNNPTFTNKEDIKNIYNDMLNYPNDVVRYLLLFTYYLLFIQHKDKEQ